MDTWIDGKDVEWVVRAGKRSLQCDFVQMFFDSQLKMLYFSLRMVCDLRLQRLYTTMCCKQVFSEEELATVIKQGAYLPECTQG